MSFFLSSSMVDVKFTYRPLGFGSTFGRDLFILIWYICLHVSKRLWDLLLPHFIPYFTHAYFLLCALSFRVLRYKKHKRILKEWIQSAQDHLSVRLRGYAVRNNTQTNWRTTQQRALLHCPRDPAQDTGNSSTANLEGQMSLPSPSPAISYSYTFSHCPLLNWSLGEGHLTGNTSVTWLYHICKGGWESELLPSALERD